MSKVWILTASRVLVGLLDLVGVFLLSKFTTVALDKGQEGPNLVPFMENWSLSPISTLALALTALSFKSLSSLALSALQTRVLNVRSTELIDEATSLLGTEGFEKVVGRDSHHLHYLLTAGLRAGTAGIVGPLSALISEGSLLVFFFLFLMATSAPAALLSVAILGLTSRLLHRYLSQRQYRTGQLAGSASIRSLTRFQELIQGYRELYVGGALPNMLQKFVLTEAELSRLQTKQSIFGNIPRHVLETVVMMSLGAIAGVTLAFSDIDTAILLITVFGAATARILPSLVPLQASLSELQSNIGKSHELESFMNFLSQNSAQDGQEIEPVESARREPVLELRDVSYRYPGADVDAIRGVSLVISGVGWLAVDGPSGSGKSTLLDLILGLRRPTTGRATMNGVDSARLVRTSPGYCSYLPQRIAVINGTIAENVAFGRNLNEIDLAKVASLVSLVGLTEVVDRSQQGLLQPIGEMGSGVSGGQMQRLGIARCLYNDPRVLLLDESTTGLDATTKESILDVIEELSHRILVVSISHDPAITMRAGTVFRMSRGSLEKSD